MKKYTCTFPKFKYKILKIGDITRKGDLFNYSRPVKNNNKNINFDYWSRCTGGDRIQNEPGGFQNKGWVVIRPLEPLFL